MIFNDGGFSGLIALGALLGFLGLCFQGLAKGGQFPQLQQLLIGFIIYYCGFVPKTTVAVHDTYTHEIKMVDNLPLAFAAGSLISKVGYYVTSKFEQDFSTPGMTSYGFADPLELLSTVRKNAMDTLSYSGNGTDGDVIKSWTNYIQDCTLMGVDRGDLYTNEIYKSEDFLGALRYNHNGLTTRLYLKDGIKDLSCKEGWVELNKETNGSFKKELDDELKNYLVFPDGITNTEDRVKKTLNTLSIASSKAANFMLVSALQPVYFEAAKEKAIRFQQPEYAAMVNQALIHRDTQNATEASIFMTIVRPLMAFMEAFVFSVMPFMAFLVVIGSKGITLAGKYIFLLIWIQMWNPLLSIVNLYILNTASNEIAGFMSATTSGISMANIDDMGLTLQHWLGVGGMMASSVPALAMMLLYGSAVTATSLMSKMQSGANINEKMATPDAMAPAPAFQSQNGYAGDTITGVAKTNMPTGMPEFSASQAYSTQTSYAKGLAENSTTDFSRLIGNNMSQRWGEMTTANQGIQLRNTLRGDDSTATSANIGRMEKLAEAAGYKGEQAKALVGAYSHSVMTGTHASFSPSVFGFGAGASGSNTKGRETRETNQSSSGDWKKFENLVAKEFGSAKELRGALTRSIAKDISGGKGSTWTKGLDKAEEDKITEGAKNTTTLNEKYENAANSEARYQTNQSQNLKVASAEVAKSEEGYNTLMGAITGNASLQAAFARNAELHADRFAGMSPKQQQAAIGLLTLSQNQSDFDSAQKLTNVLEKTGLAGADTGAPNQLQQGEGSAQAIQDKHDTRTDDINGAPRPDNPESRVEGSIGETATQRLNKQNAQSVGDGDRLVKDNYKTGTGKADDFMLGTKQKQIKIREKEVLTL